MGIIDELKRRNVVRMAILYVVAAWLVLQVADVLFDAMELPAQWTRLVLAILLLGFPVVPDFLLGLRDDSGWTQTRVRS